MQYSDVNTRAARKLHTHRRVWQSYAKPDGNSYGNGAFANTDGNCYSHGSFANADRNCYSNRNSDCTATAYTDTTASTDTAAAPGQLLL